MAATVIIKKSLIEGKGVFANKDFEKDEIVILWNLSKIMTKEQLNTLPKSELKYVSPYGRNKFILHLPPERFVNHSCQPNTKIINDADVAVREIKKGEEITTDYTKEGNKLEFKCKCPKHKK